MALCLLAAGMTRPMQKLFGLDLLRALAIGLVFYGHIGVEFMPSRLEWFMRTRPDGVGLFFVLSGFLISLSLMHHLEAGGSYRRFWLKRAVRTMPPFFVAIALYGVLVAVLPTDKPAPSPWSFVFLQNVAWPVRGGFPEGWSLSVEEWYYASFILIAAVVPLPREKRLLVGALSLLAVALFYRATLALQPVLTVDGWTGTIQQTVLGRLDGPAIGVLAAYTFLRHQSWWQSNRVTGACLVLGLLGTWGLTNVGVSLIDTAPGQGLQDWQIRAPAFWYLANTLEAVSWGLLLVPAVRLSAPSGWLEAIIRQTARSAFSIYLTHYSIVIWLLVPLFSSHHLLMFLILSAVISQAFYLLVERPAIGARRFVEAAPARVGRVVVLQGS
jgi:peptidoglycan/LPS O-acetylase OafA/YrhL